MLQFLEKTFDVDLTALRTAMAGHVFGLIATLVIGFLLAKVIPVAKLYEWMNARIGVK